VGIFGGTFLAPKAGKRRTVESRGDARLWKVQKGDVLVAAPA
jgi:hypothetical protein